MSQDQRAKLHALIDAYYDNVDGQYDGHTIDVVVQREDQHSAFGDAVNLEIVEEVADWDGNTAGTNGIIIPRQIYINGQKVLVRKDTAFNIDCDGPVLATMSLFVRNLVVRKRAKNLTPDELEAHRADIAYLKSLVDGDA